MADDQLFCLRWNNFQTNFTSQFEALRAEEDFVDVTLACEGKRVKAHKLVLSACSPYFKELLKGNPCKHPIIFMQDVEYEHLLSLVEFMYAGEVNIAQAQLPTFLHTAESLQIRGLTAAPKNKSSVDSTKPSGSKKSGASQLPHDETKNNTRNKSPDLNQGTLEDVMQDEGNAFSPKPSPSKKVCLPLEQPHHSRETVMFPDISTAILEPKTEPMEYFSDGEAKSSVPASPFTGMENLGYTLQGALDAASQMSSQMSQISEWSQESVQDQYYPQYKDGKPNFITQLNDKGSNSRVSLGFGVEVRLDQLRGVKWSDYRKLTRGLASILFSHQELATRSVTGQRWSRYLSAGDSRPVKPALDPAKIHAIITYVRALFPHVAASHIKQVLAYKCKECAAAVAHKTLPSSSA